MNYVVKKGGHADLRRIYPMMQFDFNATELLPLSVLHKALWDDAAELLLLRDETGTEHGYALTYTRSPMNYVLGAYVGIYPTMRGRGLATVFIGLLREHYSHKQGVIIEVTGERPKGERLMALYRSCGFVELDVPYTLNGHPYVLMLMDLQGGSLITVPVARVLIYGFYSAFMPRIAVKSMVTVGGPY